MSANVYLVMSRDGRVRLACSTKEKAREAIEWMLDNYEEQGKYIVQLTLDPREHDNSDSRQVV